LPNAATLVVVACAISAGAHAGLVPAHLEEEPRLGGAYIRDYDAVHKHILVMADGLSGGIIHQFPRRFR
jgi:hypothetical protein